MSGGYCGKILEVDLSTRRITILYPDKDLLQKYIGGSGIASAIILARLKERFGTIDPLEPANILVFMTGPLTGSTIPSSGRMVACAKSPLTGIWGESNAGGFWGPELKKAGFDGIIITGKSPDPVVLHIADQTATIESAESLWGQDALGVCRALQAKGKVLAIGQAGENLVPFASIIHDQSHHFGRCGLGAVMGSKRLKAVTVKGTGNYAPADPEELAQLRRELVNKQRESMVVQALSAFGTNCNMDLGYMLGDVPIKNWQAGQWEGIEKINGPAFHETFQIKKGTCFACPVACKRILQLPQGVLHGPEYETVASFGAMCLIDDPAAIVRFNELCNCYGLDTITLGSTIAFAIDCFAKGLISTADTGGMILSWSNPGLVLELIRKTGERRGFGRQLALGSERMAMQMGPDAEKYLSTVKGLECPMHDPRAGFGLGLAYATSIRGACHVSSMTMQVEQGASRLSLFGPEEGVDMGQSYDGKAEMVKKTQDIGMVFGGAALFCLLGGMAFDENDLSRALMVATGEDWPVDRIMECGERIWCLKRFLGNLCKMGKKDDRLPGAVITPLKEGSTAGMVPDMDLLLPAYYQLRGIDEQGFLLPGKLKELGLYECT